MGTVPRRDGNRPAFRTGIISSAEIEAAVKASGIKDDDETTGVKPLRPLSKEKRAIANSYSGPQPRKKKK